MNIHTSPSQKIPFSKQHVIAFLSAAFSFFSFSSMDAIVRFLGRDIPTFQIGLYQRSFCVIIYIILLTFICIRTRSYKILKIRYVYSHLIRGILIFAITLAFIQAFVLLPLNNAYSIIFSLPLFTVIFGKIFIKETIGKFRLISITAGFIGILIVLRPGFSEISQGYFYALLGVLLEVPMFIMIKHYHKDDHPLNIAFYPSIIALICFVLYLVFFYNAPLVAIDGFQLVLFVMFGAFTIMSQYFLNYSFKYLKTGLTTSMQYTQIIWGSLYGYLVFKDTSLDVYYIIGTTIIILSSITTTLNRFPFLKKKTP